MCSLERNQSNRTESANIPWNHIRFLHMISTFIQHVIFSINDETSYRPRIQCIYSLTRVLAVPYENAFYWIFFSSCINYQLILRMKSQKTPCRIYKEYLQDCIDTERLMLTRDHQQLYREVQPIRLPLPGNSALHIAFSELRMSRKFLWFCLTSVIMVHQASTSIRILCYILRQEEDKTRKYWASYWMQAPLLILWTPGEIVHW
jgi:hypothetical protein